METKRSAATARRRFETRMANFVSKESRENLNTFTPEPTDVIISTSPKSGTTWVQQICHGLRSGGDMTFDEIDLAVLNLEGSKDYGCDIRASQAYTPRMFKTHQWRHACPKGAGKYIVVVRDPADAALSLFTYLKDWLFVDGEVSLDEFVDYWFGMDAPANNQQGWTSLHHTLSWYPHRLDDNVLWLHYEDLKDNLRTCVRLIANFLDIGKDDDALQELVTKQASLEFMQKHRSKFDAHQLKSARNEALGLPKDAGLAKSAAKVHVGRSGRGKKMLSEKTIAFIDKRWKRIVTSQTGHTDYESFRAAINKELGRVLK